MKNMIKYVILALLFIQTGYGQAIEDNIELTVQLDENPGLPIEGFTAYTVYARPIQSYMDEYFLGNTQITVVLPLGTFPFTAPGNMFVWSLDPLNWTNPSFQSHNGNDHYAITNTGGSLNGGLPLLAGEEYPLFTFYVVGPCNNEVRLFINGVDPTSSEMPGGGDFENNFYHQIGAGVFTDEYLQNYGGPTTVCLPIELLSFDAIKAGSTAIVSWVTLIELDNDYYEVERSDDDKDFRVIGKVAGAGTDYNKNNYSYVDERPMSGINYYRLKQVDYDGGYSYSRVKSLYFEESGRELSLYPNPAREEIELVTGKKSSKVHLRILDVKGQEVFSQAYQTGDWKTNQRLDLSDYAEGMYIIEIIEGNHKETSRFVKVK